MKIKITRNAKRKIESVEYFDTNPRAKKKLKPVKKSYLNALLKVQKTPFWREIVADSVIENPFSGVPAHFNNSLEASIARWCYVWYHYYSKGKMIVPVQTYDNLKYFLLFLNHEAYTTLID